MKRWTSLRSLVGTGMVIWLISGCQAPPQQVALGGPKSSAIAPRLTIESSMVWGGQIRCDQGACLVAVIEHENNIAALHRLQGRSVRLLDRHPVAYHPDSAVWLTNEIFAAAVEGSSGLDIFRVQNERLVRLQQLPVGFAPRDVVALNVVDGHHRMLVTPYSGKEVAWVDWKEGAPESVRVRKVHWCEAPWHPVRVERMPSGAGGGFVSACLDDRRVIAVSDTNLFAPPRVLATFDAIARTARPTPSGKWLYVALETGERNARISMDTGELQWLSAPPTGAVAIAPLDDDMVIWGDDRQLYIQRLDAQGQVLETRWLQASGFATGLQLIDIDGDGERDVAVFNSSPSPIDVIYGPLWDNASRTPIVPPKK